MALGEKSIRLSTKLKNEFSMKQRIMSLNNLKAISEESIDIVEKRLDNKHKKRAV